MMTEIKVDYKKIMKSVIKPPRSWWDGFIRKQAAGFPSERQESPVGLEHLY